ncbi:DUF2264 domain-containing protein [Saccharothrix variisporea]|uniref:DUF2264 domain-containing protein n=1 Tax=Saccharothrix variisporea TaxID=543527 RepID=A0A495XTA4_9PSEU|nr:DUF2264 domain-containing protein [Saccharothrix variisporea]RKT74908.1 hypothetical protein DFJ66_8283 [Saccharothrix variisporea]
MSSYPSPRTGAPTRDDRSRDGWTREDWARTADGMLRAVRPYASPGHARITLPGPPGGYGSDVDGLEGFARTFLLAGFRIAGERGADPGHLAEWYAEGIATGTDPASPERWVRLDEHPQAKVEAASLALALDLTRPWLWDRLDAAVRERVVAYLAPAVGDPTYPRINWVWFRLVVQAFLRSVGGPWSAADVEEDLATHDGFLREDGWLADGHERAFDHYVGWALHLYPQLWSRMAGAAGFAEARRARDTALLDRFLLDAVRLVGADGSPLVQGRSLAYRFAAAAPFWVGVLAEVPSTPLGVLRRAATSVVRHFTDRGAPDDRGLLTLGWHGPWPRLAQSYSGPGSPYWAVKGMFGLALPADHPVWTAEELPLPVERDDYVDVIRAPGWLVSGTVADGVVRVVNHGTDHALPGDTKGDSPLYARLGYSTATSPLLDRDSWADPHDQAVVLLDARGRGTHRSGMTAGPVRTVQSGGVRVAVGSSSGVVRWLEPDRAQQDHGSGWTGRHQDAGTLQVHSLVRGPWEVRLVRVDDLADDRTPTLLRLSGWAVTGARTGETGPRSALALGDDGTRSSLTALIGTPTRTGVAVRADASPLGALASVPQLHHPVATGTWLAVLVELTRDPAPWAVRPEVEIRHDGSTTRVTTRWPDGARTRVATA